MTMGSRAVFLDRDDTLIRNVPYLGDPSKVELLPTVREALEALGRAGFRMFVASNQSGVGRGLITTEQVAAVNAEMARQMGGSWVEGYYNCYAAPEDSAGAEDRKPAPGLLLRAASERGLDLKKSFMVGDRLSDIQCGKNAGCRSVLVLTAPDRDCLEQAKAEADCTVATLKEAADWILGQEAA
jgi:D-glycero-D-manno-heptose 1,7-bisphosphate phosphatase